MRRKIGPIDISYCSTNCVNTRCKRNIMFYKPPMKYFSCCSFDTDNEDELHTKCIWKLEDKNNE